MGFKITKYTFFIIFAASLFTHEAFSTNSLCRTNFESQMLNEYSSLISSSTEPKRNKKYEAYLQFLIDKKIVTEVKIKKLLINPTETELKNLITIKEAAKNNSIRRLRDLNLQYVENGIDVQRVQAFFNNSLNPEEMLEIKKATKESKNLNIKIIMDFIKVDQLGTVVVAKREKTGTEFKVAITVPFEIMRYPVTQRMFAEVMEYNPSEFAGDIEVDINGNMIPMQPDHPVENLTMDEMKEFIKKKNADNDGYIYDLPTEAQWLLITQKTNLENIAPNEGWFLQNSNRKTQVVGVKKPIIIGVEPIYELFGNVWEHLKDYENELPRNNTRNWYQSKPRGRSFISTIHDTPTFIMRGSSHSAETSSVGQRTIVRDNSKSNDLGFRLVRVKKDVMKKRKRRGGKYGSSQSKSALKRNPQKNQEIQKTKPKKRSFLRFLIDELKNM